ncbi:hypothetical protein HG530_008827 [Fusarium avenaceum]|nr:hypothetical protein HG530_008827 [Fusarium avenaceum]
MARSSRGSEDKILEFGTPRVLHKGSEKAIKYIIQQFNHLDLRHKDELFEYVDDLFSLEIPPLQDSQDHSILGEPSAAEISVGTKDSKRAGGFN